MIDLRITQLSNLVTKKTWRTGSGSGVCFSNVVPLLGRLVYRISESLTIFLVCMEGGGGVLRGGGN